MWVGSQSHAPTALPPGMKPSIYCTGGGGVRFGAVLDMYRKVSLPPRFELRTAQPLASRYTDYTTSTAS